ncbi:MAG: extracellular solute-binding protein [Lentisphaerae bacterium]|nr:extracellular solute-binding protein [Lentisphaerota bacterium]
MKQVLRSASVGGLLVGVAVLLTCLPGCAREGEAPGGTKTTVVWWGFIKENGDIVKQAAEKLVAEGVLQDVEVVLKVYGYEELYDKLLAVFLAGGQGAPDLVDVEISSAGRFFKQDPVGFIDLSERFENSPYRDDFLAARNTPWTFRNRLYGLSWGCELSILYYRLDIFETYGIEVPFDTWDDYVKAGLTLKEHGIYMVQVPNGANPDNYNEDFIPQLLIQQGGGYFDENGNVTVASEAGLRAITLVDDMVNRHGIALASASDIFDPPFYVPYKQGKVATFIMPNWMLHFFMEKNMPELAGKWRITSLPAWEEGGLRTSTAGGTSLSITRACKNPDTAWKILEKTIMTPEMGMVTYRETLLFPPIKSVLSDPALDRPDPYLGGQSMAQYFREYSPQVPTYHISPFWWDAHLLMASEVLFPVLKDKVSPEEGLKNMEMRLHELMK